MRGDEPLATCRALLVDLDGTLLDTTAAVEASWTRAGTDLGIPLDQLRPLMHGVPGGQVLARLRPDLSVEERQRIVEQLLVEQFGPTAPVGWLTGAAELVAALNALPWAVVTSGTRDIAAASMRKVGMAAPPVMVTADDVSQGKPHPEPFLVAARQLQVEPLDCVALEDSPAGVTAAREAGMRVIAVTTTYPAEHLAHASLVLPQLPEARADTTRSVIELRSSSLIPGTGVEAP